MDAPGTDRRRWLTHERTVLLVVALVVVFGLATGLGWLGWQTSIVRHRRAMRTQIEASGALVIVDVVSAAAFPKRVDWRYAPLVVTIRPAAPDPGISNVRRRLGDWRVESLFFNRQLTDADKEAIRAFPEAEIQAIPAPARAP
jgi:hypothetical protein